MEIAMHGEVKQLEQDRKTIENYPDNRAPYEGERSLFPWRSYPQYLQTLWALVEMKASSVQIAWGSDYGSYGINTEYLAREMHRLHPELRAVYRAKTGSEFKDKLFMQRVYMWFLSHRKTEKGCDKGFSKEHPILWSTGAELNKAIERVRLG
jgi:hypothetical protein